ncbi:MAG TPA: MFS transporter [Solirubrobacteraceae bacterium]|nr:MFS transporter [Solirubrobacteraceae bacterium]
MGDSLRSAEPGGRPGRALLRTGARKVSPRTRGAVRARAAHPFNRRERRLRFARIRANLHPLRAPAFGRLLTSYTLNSVGDYVGLVALAVLVYAETQDPLATAALFIAMQFLPAFVAPVLTARLDQLAPRAVLPALYACEGIIFATLAWIATSFWLPAVLLLAFVDGCLMLTARGLTRGVVNGVLQPAGLLREGNGLLNVGFAMSSVGGAALGGLLVETYGASTALAVDAASFVVIAAILATCRHLPSAHAERQPFLERMRAGLSYVRSDRVARVLVSGEALALVFFTIIVPIEVVYARETLATDDAGYGLLLSAWGAGVVLGSLVFLTVRRRRAITLILLSTLAIGAAYLGMSVARELWLACGFSVLGGLGNGVQWVSVMTALQESTPQDLQARVTGVLESVASAMTGAGFLLGGVITALTTPPTAFAVSGLGVVVVVVFLAVAWRGLHPLPHATAEPAKS